MTICIISRHLFLPSVCRRHQRRDFSISALSFYRRNTDEPDPSLQDLSGRRNERRGELVHSSSVVFMCLLVIKHLWAGRGTAVHVSNDISMRWLQGTFDFIINLLYDAYNYTEVGWKQRVRYPSWEIRISASQMMVCSKWFSKCNIACRVHSCMPSKLIKPIKARRKMAMHTMPVYKVAMIQWIDG